jgi:hypothetical protein
MECARPSLDSLKCGGAVGCLQGLFAECTLFSEALLLKKHISSNIFAYSNLIFFNYAEICTFVEYPPNTLSKNF